MPRAVAAEKIGGILLFGIPDHKAITKVRRRGIRMAQERADGGERSEAGRSSHLPIVNRCMHVRVH
jgi:hypothetical protein